LIQTLILNLKVKGKDYTLTVGYTITL